MKTPMKRIASNAVAIAIAVVLPLSAANAQRGQTGIREGMRGAEVEDLLRMRERLELTDEQLRQLEELRVAALERRKTRMAEMMDLQSRRRAGDLEQEERRDLMTERREGYREAARQQRERVAAILTDDQRERLATFRAQRASGRRSIRGARMRGRAAGGFRGRGFSRGSVDGWRRPSRFRRRDRAGPDGRFRRRPV